MSIFWFIRAISCAALVWQVATSVEKLTSPPTGVTVAFQPRHTVLNLSLTFCRFDNLMWQDSSLDIEPLKTVAYRTATSSNPHSDWRLVYNKTATNSRQVPAFLLFTDFEQVCKTVELGGEGEEVRIVHDYGLGQSSNMQVHLHEAGQFGRGLQLSKQHLRQDSRLHLRLEKFVHLADTTAAVARCEMGAALAECETRLMLRTVNLTAGCIHRYMR